MSRATAVIGLGVLVFLCSSDLVFAERIAGVNIRWGQLALLAVAGVVQWRELSRGVRPVVDRLGASAWLVFFLAYFLAALAAPDTPRTLLKLAWGVLNVALAARLCLSGIPARTLLSGFALASVCMAFIVWVDAIATQWLGQLPAIGFAQQSMIFEGRWILRPHAFHYEPSFVGAALAFATPVMIAVPGWKGVAASSLVASAVVLTSSRTGILGVVVGSMVYLVLSLRRPVRTELRRVAVAVVGMCLMLGAFALHPEGTRFMRFIAGPLGPAHEVARIERSESDRLGNAVRAVGAFRENPLLGRGVVAGRDRAIGTQTYNVWLEIGVESGLVGLLSFATAIAATIAWAVRRGATPHWLWAAWVIHLVVNFNFTQSFPRLDYWLWFFLAIRLAREHGRAHDITNAPELPNSAI